MPTPRHTLTDPPAITFAPRTPTDDARELETALALATHQVAALAAGVEATVSEAIVRLEKAVADAEARLEAAAARLGG
ncbi:MAG: hypothetical protein ABR549_01375 [Mycobacteriales bacterium]